MSSKIEDTPQKTLSCWPLAFSAGLLGIGQNGLLVVLPVLVIQTNLSLSVWAALLMLGSMLFLPSSPWWGKQISLTGSKTVVLWALGGYGVSFTLLGLGSVLMATGAVTTAVGLGILIIARIVYGLTVSAMVPACQVWALQRAGEGNRMAALATISSGLSDSTLSMWPDNRIARDAHYLYRYDRYGRLTEKTDLIPEGAAVQRLRRSAPLLNAGRTCALRPCGYAPVQHRFRLRNQPQIFQEDR